jgi:hypothetical protein
VETPSGNRRLLSSDEPTKLREIGGRETCSELKTELRCDNTPHHNLKINKVPNSNSAEEYMRGWHRK